MTVAVLAVGAGVAAAVVAGTATSFGPSPTLPGAPRNAASTGRAASTPGSPSPTASPLAITAAAYGSLSFNAPAGASCSITIGVVPGTRGERPPTTIAAAAGASGQLDLQYSAPRVPAGRARYDISCDTTSGSLSASASFTVPARTISAAGFTVHVVADRGVVDGVVDDPALVPVRDAILARIRSDLVAEWGAATRGLGAAALVEESADIRIIVAAQRGTSVNRTDADSSQDVIVYAEDDSGMPTPENSVAVALHELGHIWCCRGPGTTAGHWATTEQSPGLYGVDRYGLMNHPVECLKLPTGLETCPNRFSDRELRSMGFVQIPAPVTSPCVARSLQLKAQLADVEARLDALAPVIEATNRSAGALAAEIAGVERQYPAGIPASVYPRYSDLVARYNSLVSSNRPRIDSYNSLVQEQHAIAGQLQALPCAS